jgi:hypothetical protein
MPQPPAAHPAQTGNAGASEPLLCLEQHSGADQPFNLPCHSTYADFWPNSLQQSNPLAGSIIPPSDDFLDRFLVETQEGILDPQLGLDFPIGMDDSFWADLSIQRSGWNQMGPNDDQIWPF